MAGYASSDAKLKSFMWVLDFDPSYAAVVRDHFSPSRQTDYFAVAGTWDETTLSESVVQLAWPASNACLNYFAFGGPATRPLADRETSSRDPGSMFRVK